MNNVPADVVRAMGARRVVAVNVGDLADRAAVDYSLFALAGATLDAMMRANTKVGDQAGRHHHQRAARRALDRSTGAAAASSIAEGYKAAEAMRDSLLPLAVSEAEYAKWEAGRHARRRTTLPVPAFARSRASAPATSGTSTICSRATSASRSASRRFQTDLAVLVRPRPLRDHHLALRQERRRRERAARGGAAEAVRSARS